MITEATPWRNELLAIADRLGERDADREWSERKRFEVERDLMVAAYAIRRLRESNLVSSLLAQKRLPVVLHKRTGPIPMTIWDDDISRYYDIGHEQRTDLDVPSLCNQLIHSFIFLPFLDERGSTLVALTSDKTKASHLYVVQLDALIELIRYVGSEDIVSSMGSMCSGVMTVVNVSNHDLHEAPADPNVAEAAKLLGAAPDRMLQEWITSRLRAERDEEAGEGSRP